MKTETKRMIDKAAIVAETKLPIALKVFAYGWVVTMTVLIGMICATFAGLL